jgi:drug/metabolite transporter (DMT)-like permease
LFADSQFTPIGFSLAATLAWGTSDFLGGYGARRSNAFLLTTITHASGTLLMLILVLLSHAPVPTASSIRWSMLAGLVAGISLAIFYHALSLGQMGMTAPVAAVLGAAIPALFGIFTEGMPGRIPMAGFLVAGMGIWLIARTESFAGRPQGLGLAVLAGAGFAGYFLCTRAAGNGSPLWIAGLARAASLVATGAVVAAGRQFKPITAAGVRWGFVAGLLDVSGSALYIHASQLGRLDAAVVISSLYPAITVILARIVLKEYFSHWRMLGLLAAVVAVPMIAW